MDIMTLKNRAVELGKTVRDDYMIPAVTLIKENKEEAKALAAVAGTFYASVKFAGALLPNPNRFKKRNVTEEVYVDPKTGEKVKITRF